MALIRTDSVYISSRNRRLLWLLAKAELMIESGPQGGLGDTIDSVADTIIAHWIAEHFPRLIERQDRLGQEEAEFLKQLRKDNPAP